MCEFTSYSGPTNLSFLNDSDDVIMGKKLTQAVNERKKVVEQTGNTVVSRVISAVWCPIKEAIPEPEGELRASVAHCSLQ